MALVALDIEVFEAQRISGVFVMVEKRFFPIVLLVAGFTLVSEVAPVRLLIVLLVA